MHGGYNGLFFCQVPAVNETCLLQGTFQNCELGCARTNNKILVAAFSKRKAFKGSWQSVVNEYFVHFEQFFLMEPFLEYVNGRQPPKSALESCDRPQNEAETANKTI